MRMKLTTTDHETWQILFARQVPNIYKFACDEFIQGFKALDLPSNKIPSLSWLNQRMKKATGWSIVYTPIRYMSCYEWADSMGRKEFPITGYSRERKDINYTPEPDIFHDIFGHLPMLMNEKLLKLLNLFAGFYFSSNDTQLALVSQLWWNTFEFGLTCQKGKVKAFGAGLMSSYGEIPRIETSDLKTVRFNLENGMKDNSVVAKFHNRYVISESVDQIGEELEKFKALQALRSQPSSL